MRNSTSCDVRSHMVEKYQFQGIASLLSHRRTVWAAHLSPSRRKCHLSTQEFEEVTRSVPVLSAGRGTWRYSGRSRTTTALIPPASTRSTRNSRVCWPSWQEARSKQVMTKEASVVSKCCKKINVSNHQWWILVTHHGHYNPWVTTCCCYSRHLSPCGLTSFKMLRGYHGGFLLLRCWHSVSGPCHCLNRLSWFTIHHRSPLRAVISAVQVDAPYFLRACLSLCCVSLVVAVFSPPILHRVSTNSVCLCSIILSTLSYLN